ncbi:MAG: hypothetical protein LBB60_02790 [Desulfovibrio sp.]|jgi:transcriptional regulator with XRE-family HTH domain|nr:hypothetical protein [Desulfovibrio sp.]
MPKYKISSKDISNRLKLFMEKNSAKGKNMAETGGISEQAFSGYLNEKNLPASPILASWATNLGMNINWLLTGEGQMLLKIPPSEASAQHGETALLRQRVADMEKTIAAQEKTIALQEEKLLQQILVPTVEEAQGPAPISQPAVRLSPNDSE